MSIYMFTDLDNKIYSFSKLLATVKIPPQLPMAKIIPMSHIDSFSGKYNRTDEVYTKIRAFDEQVIGVRLKHPNTNYPPTSGQAAAQQKMTAIAAQAKAIFSDAEQLSTYRADWKKQKRIPTLTGYVYAQLYKQSNGEG